MDLTRHILHLGLIAAAGCGLQQNDEIPPELVEAIAAGAEEPTAASYPEGPYGSNVGDIAHNVCFRLWPDPNAADYDAEELTPTCLADFWDPTGEERSIILINTAALWCQACRVEYGGTGQRPSLKEEASLRREQGFTTVGLLFQDAARGPASAEDATRWAQTFEVDFPFGLDSDFEMGRFASETVQPFNMVVDARTMEILLVLQGDEPDTLWPTVDGFLDAEN